MQTAQDVLKDPDAQASFAKGDYSALYKAGVSPNVANQIITNHQNMREKALTIDQTQAQQYASHRELLKKGIEGIDPDDDDVASQQWSSFVDNLGKQAPELTAQLPRSVAPGQIRKTLSDLATTNGVAMEILNDRAAQKKVGAETDEAKARAEMYRTHGSYFGQQTTDKQIQFAATALSQATDEADYQTKKAQLAQQNPDIAAKFPDHFDPKAVLAVGTPAATVYKTDNAPTKNPTRASLAWTAAHSEDPDERKDAQTALDALNKPTTATPGQSGVAARFSQREIDQANTKQDVFLEKEQKAWADRATLGAAAKVKDGEDFVDPRDNKTYTMDEARRASITARYQKASDDAQMFHQEGAKIRQQMGWGEFAGQQQAQPAAAQPAATAGAQPTAKLADVGLAQQYLLKSGWDGKPGTATPAQKDKARQLAKADGHDF